MAAEPLGGFLFLHQSSIVYVSEDLLDYLFVERVASPAEVVEGDVEPGVDLFMNIVVFIAKLFGGCFLCQGLDLAGCAVLVGAADEEGVVTHQSAVPCEDVCGEDSSDDVAEVGLVVDVWECGCYEHVAFI